MKLRAIAAACMLVMFSAGASAQQAGVTVQGQLAAGRDAPSVMRIMVEPYVAVGRGGLWGFIYGVDGYASAVGGPYVDLFKRGETALEVGAGIGVEHAGGERHGPPLRYAASVTLLASRGKAEIYYEQGHTGGRWIQAEATMHAASALDVGLFHQSDDGTGPRAIVSIPGTRLKIWGGPMFKQAEDGRHVRTVWLAGLDVTVGK